MPSYGLKYQCSFDPLKLPVSANPVYTLEILQKNYSGGAVNVTGGAVPVLHQWQTDDPKAPVKGSSLSINLINEGSLPIQSFYSVADDEFKVRHWYKDQLIFEGYIIQDDTSEVMVDFTHEINLSANDNLGLLKDVALDKADVFTASFITSQSIGADEPTRSFLVLDSFAVQVAIGDKIKITGTPIDGTYTVINIVHAPPSARIDVSEALPATYVGTATLTVLSREELIEKIPLLTIIHLCISSTGLELSTNIYGNIYATGDIPVSEVTSFGANASLGIIQLLIPAADFLVGQVITITDSVSNNGTFTITAIDTASYFARLTVTEGLTDENNTQNVTVTWDKLTWFLNTLVDPQTFLKNDTDYEDCYTILTEILRRFNCCLFQSLGRWNIVRWDELRHYANLIEGKVYDSDFNFTGTDILAAPFSAGIGETTVAETGLLQKILRPFEYVKETFNYKQPAQLLRNYNLQQLGDLINSYTTGSGDSLRKINEYTATWWYPSTRPDAGSGTYFIRIVSDNLDNEIERFLVLTHDVQSYKIEANEGDAIKFSFSFRTEDSQATLLGSLSIICIVELYDGTTTTFYNNPSGSDPGGWESALGFVYEIGANDDSNQWHTVEIDTTNHRIPYNGIISCYLRIADLFGTINETYYKDIRFEYTALINESTKIIGHTHKSSQSGTIKQNEDEEIFIDTSPRNSIAGTLFLKEMNGLLQKRTARWKELWDIDTRILGNIITFEELFWRRLPRTIIEGSLYGLTNGVIHASLLSVFKYTYFNNLNFVGGKLEIDYKNNKLTGTLWEIWQDGAPNCKNYTFSGFGFPVGAWSINGLYCDGTPFNFSSISGSGAIPTETICARVGSITSVGNIIVTEGESCGVGIPGEMDSDLISVYEFKYLYSAK